MGRITRAILRPKKALPGGGQEYSVNFADGEGGLVSVGPAEPVDPESVTFAADLVAALTSSGFMAKVAPTFTSLTPDEVDEGAEATEFTLVGTGLEQIDSVTLGDVSVSVDGSDTEISFMMPVPPAGSYDLLLRSKGANGLGPVLLTIEDALAVNVVLTDLEPLVFRHVSVGDPIDIDPSDLTFDAAAPVLVVAEDGDYAFVLIDGLEDGQSYVLEAV